MASSRATETLSQTVARFMTVNLRTKFMIKRSYDDWTFKQIFADRKRRAYINAQSLNVDLHARLGSDLAVSHFIIGMVGGRVRDHTGTWVSRLRDLPNDYDESFKLSAIEASDSRLITEGMDNFVGLERLETLDLSKNPHLDDFACDQLARQFLSSKTLTAINLSYNPLISVYGIETLMRIPSLKNITALSTAASTFSDIDLFILAAEDERQCQVFVHEDGRQFKTQELEDVRLETVPIPRLKSD
uniref:ATP synthase subunit s-like protein n=1 Tax=Aceria tosichella TaxID=561515 RepID=A0A6G1SPF1_9ACAR